jgi:AraC family transcriptional regulator of adaptative response / DNA-3-methyladenine glycosylase II
MLDADRCWQAVEARDSRYDGRFWCGVTSTGIYCRPTCTSRTPLRKNVRFYTTLAAARADGFRACKRCRPDGGD